MTAKDVQFESVRYLEEPLSAALLKRLLRLAGLKPEDAIRTNESAYHEFVAGKKLSGQELITLMVEHPELIQRPFVVRGNKAVLARPVDRLSQLKI